jgi:hypothetical protein
MRNFSAGWQIVSSESATTTTTATTATGEVVHFHVALNVC